MNHDPVELLQALVRCESISGNEERALQTLEAWLSGHGVPCQRLGRNLIAHHGSGEPVLWLNSHLDTVQPAEGYTFDPWSGELTPDGRVLGLGANDAKGSVAAMASALVEFRLAHPSLTDGTLCLVATCDEETAGLGLEWVLTQLPHPEAAIIGEPNRMRVANCCKGRVLLRLVAEGVSAHASRPWQGVNALREALPALQALLAQPELPLDPVLGRATHEPTVIRGGQQSNAIPGLVEVVVDARTTPTADNDTMLEHLRRVMPCPVVPADGYDKPSVRLEIVRNTTRPTRTNPDGRLVRAALASRHQPEVVGFEGVCDFVHVGHLDALIMGPGEPSRSHRADEFLLVSELKEAVPSYVDVAERYLNQRRF